MSINQAKANSIARIKEYTDALTSISDVANKSELYAAELAYTNALASISDAISDAANKSELYAAELAYKIIRTKLTASIKTHMKHAESSFANIECYYKNTENECLGDLKFINPHLYLTRLDSDDDFGIMITPADRLLAYKFFMFREAIQDFARKLEPDWVVTFKEGSSAPYTRHDVLDSFKYVDSNQNAILGHKGNKVNKEAWDILKSEIKEVEQIIKGVFEEYSDDCNKLKVITNPHHQATICTNIYKEETDPNYFLNLLTCLETFNIAAAPGFCQGDNSDLHSDL